MVENSKIEWCDHTHNEWIGCSKVSPGCEHCYAEELMDTRYGRVEWGPNGTRGQTAEANRKKPFTWDRAAKKAGVRYRVFCSSLSDVFEDRDELVPWRTQLFSTINNTPNLDWLVLTKRPENVLRMGFEQQLWWPDTSFPRNVWIGTSVEDQKRAYERIPELLKIPATIRFLSMEPLLGPVELWNLPCGDQFDAEGPRYYDALKGFAWWPNGDFGIHGPQIHWVIVGGESGRKARPMHPDWVESIRSECQKASVPFFFKQWGEWHNGSYENMDRFTVLNDGDYFPEMATDQIWQMLHHRKWTEHDWTERNPTVMCRTGKKIAGRDLDGREWSEFPNIQKPGG